MSRWAERYLLVPFRDGGRDMKGLDCWGLIREVYSDQLGIELPSYGEISAHDMRKIAERMAGDTAEGEVWRPIKTPEAFDVVVMSWAQHKIIAHVGVMIDAKRLLHIEPGTYPAIVQAKHPFVARRIRGYFRHRDMVRNAIAAAQ